MRARFAAALVALILSGCECDEGDQFVKVGPELNVEPNHLDFGNVPLGAVGRLSTTIRNVGLVPVVVVQSGPDLPFSTESGPLQLAAGQSIQLEVTYRPSEEIGAQSALTLRIEGVEDDYPVSLSGQGTTPTMTVHPTKVEFTAVPVGTTRSVDIVAHSLSDQLITGTLSTEGFARPESFALTSLTSIRDSSEIEIPPRGAGVYSFEYRPSSPANDQGRVVLAVCGPGCRYEVDVEASAVESALRLSPSILDLGDVAIGTSARGQITVENLGDQPFHLTDLQVAGIGSLTATPARGLPTLITREQPLVIDLQVNARFASRLRGQLVVYTDDPRFPEARASIQANAVGSSFLVQPSEITFGSVRDLGPHIRPAILLNAGSAPVRVSSIAVEDNPAFAVESTSLPLTLGPGESSIIEVSLSADHVGEYLGNLIVTSDDSQTPRVEVGIRGYRVERACELSIYPGRVNFGFRPVGLTDTQPVTLLNPGPDPCELTGSHWEQPMDPGMKLRGTPFPRTLEAGQSMVLDIEYTSVTQTETKNRLSIDIADPVTPHRVISVWVQSFIRGSQLTVTPPSVDFGSVPEAESRRAYVEVINSGLSDAAVTANYLAPGSSSDFQITTTPSFRVRAGFNALVEISYVASTSTIATGTLILDTTDTGRPRFSIPLHARRVQPNICVDPHVIAYGPVAAPTTRTFRIWGCGRSAVDIHSVDWTAPNRWFRMLNPPSPQTLQPGQEILVNVEFSPPPAGAQAAEIDVVSSDYASPRIKVEMTGGPEIVPVEAGRFLYFWRIDGVNSDIMQLPLQGPPIAAQFWGSGNQKGCTGCHALSPDGKFVAVIDATFRLSVIDRASQVVIPIGSIPATHVSWNPNPQTDPPYQLVYSIGDDVHKLSLFGGSMGTVAGANDPAIGEGMPTWGPDGKIAFIRSTSSQVHLWMVQSASPELHTVPESGGSPTLVQSPPRANMLIYNPAYSPDGRWIAYTECAGCGTTIAAPTARIRMIHPDGTEYRPLAHTNGTDGASSYATWSRDSRYLSFASTRRGAGYWDLYMVNIDPQTGADSNVRPIREANTPVFEHSAQWSP